MNLHESRKFLLSLHSDHWPPGGWKEWQPLGSSQLGEYDAMMRGLQHGDFVLFFVLFRIFFEKKNRTTEQADICSNCSNTIQIVWRGMTSRRAVCHSCFTRLGANAILILRITIQFNAFRFSFFTLSYQDLSDAFSWAESQGHGDLAAAIGSSESCLSSAWLCERRHGLAVKEPKGGRRHFDKTSLQSWWYV